MPGFSKINHCSTDASAIAVEVELSRSRLKNHFQLKINFEMASSYSTYGNNLILYFSAILCNCSSEIPCAFFPE